jgi:hypothetical protein
MAYSVMIGQPKTAGVLHWAKGLMAGLNWTIRSADGIRVTGFSRIGKPP